jgi:hypothetical protein
MIDCNPGSISFRIPFIAMFKDRMPFGAAKLFWVMLPTLFFHMSATANPTGEKPSTPIQVHGTVPEVKAAVEKLYGTYEQLERELSQIRSIRDQPAKINPKQLKEILGKVWAAQHEIRRLDGMGESAVYDLQIRFSFLHEQTIGNGVLSGPTQPGMKFSADMARKAAKEARAVAKLLEKAQKAISSGRGELVYNELIRRGSEYYGDRVLNEWKPRADAMRPWEELISAAWSTMAKAHQAKIDTAFEQAKNSLDEPITRFAETVTATKQALGTAFPIQVNDKKFENADTLLYFLVDELAISQTAMQRSISLNLAQGKTNPNFANSVKSHSDQATIEFAAVIAKLANNAAPEAAPALHRTLSEFVTAYDRRNSTDSKKLGAETAPAMAALLAKHAASEQSVEAYRRAVAPVLEFRRYFASAQVSNLGKSHPELSRLLGDKSKTPLGLRPLYAKETELGDSIVADSEIRVALKWQVPETSVRIINKAISVGPVVRLGKTSATAVAPYRNGHYVNVSVANLSHESETKALRRVLLVDDKFGPLTLEAAAALSAAELKDYTTVGGKIGRVHGESFVTRFATLPPIASALVPWGSVPSLPDRDEYSGNGMPITRLCWRVDLYLDWVATDTFVAFAGKSDNKVASR